MIFVFLLVGFLTDRLAFLSEKGNVRTCEGANAGNAKKSTPLAGTNRGAKKANASAKTKAIALAKTKAMAMAMTMKNATKPAEPLHAHAPVEDFEPTDSLFPTEFSSGHPWGTPAEIRESSESPISLFRRFGCNGQAKEKPGRKILRVIIHDSPPLVNPTARKNPKGKKVPATGPFYTPSYKRGKSSARHFTRFPTRGGNPPPAFLCAFS